MSENNKPIRTCIGCRTSKEKEFLIRLVGSSNILTVDKTGTADGRGYYICRDDSGEMCKECLALATSKKRRFTIKQD